MAEAADHPRRSRPLARAVALPRAVEAVWAAAAAGLSLVAAAATLRLWRADFGIPFDYSGDANYTSATLKGVLEHGWLGTNPSLGAPNRQEGWDFPAWNGDLLNVAVLKVLGHLLGSAETAINAYYVLSFPLVALVAYLVLRRLECSPPAATVAAVLFSLIPYHFLRGEDHLFLAAAYSVPLGAYLALATLAGDPLFERHTDARARGWTTRKTLATVGLCVVIATAGVYYAAFTVVLVAAAALLGAFVRGRRALLGPAVVCATIGVVVLATFSPTIVYRAQHGANPALERHAFETEAFSLRLAQLFLPAPGHRIDALADLKQRYEEKVGVTEASFAALGVVGSVGFAWLLVAALASVVGAGDRAAPLRVRHAAALSLVAFLFATTGGLAAAVSYLVTPQFHAWNRLSVFIAFFSLFAVAVALDALGRRMRGRRALAATVAVAVLAVGILDQTSPSFTPAYGAVESEWKSDDAFVEEIDHRLPENAAVYQLPYMPFPAAGSIQHMVDYDPLRAYLHSDDLRWSYGAIKGRPEDVGDDLAPLPPAQLVPRLRQLGFSGIWIDRDGYADDGAAVESELRPLLGAPLSSSDGRLLFFDLRGGE